MLDQQEPLRNIKVLSPPSSPELPEKNCGQISPEPIFRKKKTPDFPNTLRKFGTSSSLNPSIISSSAARHSKQVEISLDFNQSIRASSQFSQAVPIQPINLESNTKEGLSIKESANKLEENKEEVNSNIKNNKERANHSSNATEILTEKVIIGNIETTEDEEILIDTAKGQVSPRKISLKVLKSQTEIFYFNFVDAMREYENRPVGYIEGNFWIETWLERCCCFRRADKICQEFYASCEKVVIFAYSRFDISDVFYCSLVKSVYRKLEEILGVKDDLVAIGFSCENPYLNDLKHNVTNLGLLMILFLTEYIPSTIKSMIAYCKMNEIGFIKLSFDIAEITLYALRRKRFNDIMNHSQKCLEVLFFVYCGCLAQWFILHGEYQQDLPKLLKSLKINVLNDPNFFIGFTKNLIDAEAE